jgi:hypothetical protein
MQTTNLLVEGGPSADLDLLESMDLGRDSL